MIMNALTKQLLDFDFSDMFETTLVEKVIEPVGERMIKQVLLGKKGYKLKEIEQKIRNILTDESIVIEPSAENGRISIFALKDSIDAAVDVVQNIINQNSENILNSEETHVLNFKKGLAIVPVELKWVKGAAIKSLNTKGWKTAKIKNHLETQKLTENAPYAIKKCINLTWIRIKCNGKAHVIFSAKHFILARRFAMKIIHILDTEVFVTLDDDCKGHFLILSGFQSTVSKKDIANSLRKILPPNINFERVELQYEPSFETTDNQLQDVKDKIEDEIRKHTELVDFDIIIPKPKPDATIMRAYINVSDDEDIVQAAKCLSKVLSFEGLSSRPVYSSVIKCSRKICETLTSRFVEKLNELTQFIVERYPDDEPFKFDINTIDENMASLKMLSNHIEILQILQRTIYSLLEGDVLNKSFSKDFGKIFCHGGFLWLRNLEKTLDVHIIPDSRMQSIRLYGSKKKCHLIKQRLLQFLLDTENEIVKVIPLTAEDNNRMLLKTLLIQYGVNLENLISSCELRSAVLDIKSCTISLHGSQDSIGKAEKILIELANSIDLSNFSDVLEDGEMCPICACPAMNLTHRLENCGHLYCGECIQGLVDQAQFPIKCCFESCDKEIITDDICAVLRVSKDDTSRLDALLEKSLRKYIEDHPTEFYYCPAPDCSMFFDRRDFSGSKHPCPLCLNEICTKCNVVYHQGFSCEMYQGSRNDPDYSFKIWQQTSVECKRCPKCGTAIEKNGGCNHMTCGSCRSHFCWICVQEFPSDTAVYQHIPFCTKYPKW